MFNNVFENRNIDAAYIRLAAENAEQAVSLIKSTGIQGFNVTAPFKESIVKYLDKIYGEVKVIGCVNTIVNKNGKLHGYNTDCYGVTQSFKDAGITLKDKRCIVIGAGGAGKAAAYGMSKEGADVIIINRTNSAAKKAAKVIGCKSKKFEELKEQVKKANIIISALPQKINSVKKEWLNSSQIVFDANYKNSPLISIARKKDCVIINAENWLLNQAVRAYELFLGEKADKELMKKGLDYSGTVLNKLNISFIGLMGSGKTTIGKALAKKLKYEFKDIDKAIVEKQQMSVSQIFEKQGESFFRDLEHEELAVSFNSKKPNILSCGGGIVINEANRKILKENSLVVWLYASPEAIYKRINLSKRPLLQTEDPLKKLRELLNCRKGMYAGTANIIFSTERKSKNEIMKKIVQELEAI